MTFGDGGGTRIRRAAVVGAEGGPLDADTASRIERARQGGVPLAAPERRRMESAFGADFSAVRVHADGEARDLSSRIQARAFTIGQDIFFGAGPPDAGTSAGQHLLSHELAHTIQSSASSVTRTTVRRRFVDTVNGEKDWANATKKTNKLGRDVGRTRRLRAVDNAVATARTAYDAGGLPALQPAVEDLRRLIGEWETSKQGRVSVRATEMKELKAETGRLLSNVRHWRGAGYQQAIQTQADDRTQVQQWLDQGALDQGTDEPTVRKRNACQWILRQRTPLYVVTPTADSDYRTQVRDKRTAAVSGRGAFFPAPDRNAGALHQTVVNYDAEATNDQSVFTRGAGIDGWNLPGRYIAVTHLGISQGQDLFYQTIRHELQHEADKHLGAELSGAFNTAATADKQYQYALRKYKTEYRAHFYQGDDAIDGETHDPLNPTVHEGNLDWTPRQRYIYERLIERYPVIRDACLNAQFVTEINGYRNPDVEGFNKYDSLRIDDLYRALEAVPANTTDATVATVLQVYDAVDALDATDATYLNDRAQSVMMRAKIERHLDGAARTTFFQRLAARPTV